LTRKPVVRVKKVVRDPFRGREFADAGGKARHLLVQRVLVDTVACRQVDDSRKRGQPLDFRIVWGLLAGEDVRADPALAEGGADLADVDVQAAVGVLAQRGSRRGMHRNDRDAPLRAAIDVHTILFSHDAPISSRASVWKRSRSRMLRPANKTPCTFKTY